VVCTDRPPEPSAQLALPLEAEGADRLAAPAISGQHDSTANVTSVALFADCPRRYYLSRYLGWNFEAPRSAPPDDEEYERDEMDATEFGRHVHALLAGGSRDGAHPDALAMLERFASSDLGQRLSRASRVEREFDFLMVLEDVVLRGQIDLWFEDSDGSVIVDYKTDDVTSAEAADRVKYYKLQLQLYAIAIERLTKRRPERALLYFLRPNIAIAVSIGEPALAAAAQILREFRLAQDQMDFPLHEGEHCIRCPHFRGMCPAVFPSIGTPAK